jgi:hypothetical protein
VCENYQDSFDALDDSGVQAKHGSLPTNIQVIICQTETQSVLGFSL